MVKMGKNNWKNKNKSGKSNNNFKKRWNNKGGHNKEDSKPKFQRNFTQRETIVKNNLKESEVGIEEFISNLPRFTGVIKARFSDFHVNEIDLNGREIKLTNLDIPVPKEDDLENSELEKIKQDLKDVITLEMWSQLDKMIKCEEENIDCVEIDVTNMDKEKRTLIHKTIKKQYGNIVNSGTIDKDDKKFIKITKSKGRELRNRWLWPGEYVYFIVHKENVDTIQAASDLAQNLKLPVSHVNYAGSKDKRAKTSQLFCVKKREPSKIAHAARFFSYMKIGNFEFHNKVLKLGELKGNRFRIALRHVTEDDEKIIPSLEILKNNGFINYYGLQRFGNCAEIPTYKIGIALLKSEYKEACELILKPREGEYSVLKNARETWWKNRNSAEASAMLSNKKSIEKQLLDGLAQYGERDYETSLRKIARNMLMMYTHSFQSFIWNKIASRRIKEFGLKVIPGDLVYREGQSDNIPLNALDALGETTECGNIPDSDDLVEPLTEFKAKVRPLTEGDISSGKYTIFDVVLPLPGYDITYPSNVVTQWYNELLAEYDLTSEKLRHKNKTYSLGGSYRQLIIRPGNMKWKFIKYNSSTSTLIQSDYEELKGIKIDDADDGKFKALLLDFILPGSSYATMALRELLKNDTSSSSQSKLMLEEEEKHNKKSSMESCDKDKLNNEDNKNDNELCNEKKDNEKSATKSQLADKRKVEEDKDDECKDENKKIKLDS